MRAPVLTIPRRTTGRGAITPVALLAGVILLGFGLRIFHLQTQSLWFDEGWSWHLARLPLAEMASATAADRSPPLYYAALHVWLKLAGQTEFAMRYLSLMADVTVIVLVVALVRALFRLWRGVSSGAWGPALTAGLLYAACPFAVWYAQETRMYALVSALCALSSYWLLRWLLGRSPRVRRWPALAVSALALTAAVYAHYYAIFLLPAQAAVVLMAIALLRRTPSEEPATQRWDGSRAGRILAGWLFATALVVLALAPWLLTASPGFAYDDGFAFPLNTIDGRLAEWATALAAGGIARPLPEAWPLLAAGAALVAALAFVAVGRRRELLTLLALVLLPALSAAIAVRLFYPYRSVFHPRYLIYVAPPLCALLGAMAGYVRVAQPREARRIAPVLGWASLALAGVLWGPALAANYFDSAIARDDVRAATRHVVEALEPGDVIVMSRDNFAVRYYYPMFTTQRADAFPLIAMPSGLHGVLADDAQLITTINELRPSRARLLLWQDHVVDPQSIVESTLWPYGYQIGEYNFASIRLPLYQLTHLPVKGIPWQPVSATFGEQLELTGFWASAQAFAGDWFYVVLRWRALRTPATDYRVFVHVLNADGQMQFQKDKQPLNDLLPTSRWMAGQTVRDAYATVVPPDVPPGDYQIVMGVYDAGGARLPVLSSRATQAGDAVSLGTVRVAQR